MLDLLQQIPVERLVLWIFLAGVAWARLRDHTRSLRDQGKRIGSLAGRVTACETQLGLRPPPNPDGGDGG